MSIRMRSRNSRNWQLQALEDRSLPSSTISAISRPETTSLNDAGGGPSSWDYPLGGGFARSGHLISGDGRYTVFISTAANLATGQVDTNNVDDVFLFDRVTQGITLVSHAAGLPNSAANNLSLNPIISKDGRYVIYESQASNLVGGYVNGHPANKATADLYEYDRVTGTTILVNHSAVSLATSGNMSNGKNVAITNFDGRFIAFSSTATDLVAGYLPGGNAGASAQPNAYLYDSTTGSIVLVSHTAGSMVTSANKGGNIASISADGTEIILGTQSKDILSPSTTVSGVYVYNRITGINTLISHSVGSPTTAANQGAGGGLTSDDGRYVIFNSMSTDLINGFVSSGSGVRDLYCWDRDTGLITLISHLPGLMTMGGDGTSGPAQISGDGATVVFVSSATDLINGFIDNNGSGTFGANDYFAWDRASGTISLVTRADGSTTDGGNGNTLDLYLSADGRFITYTTNSTNAITGYVSGNLNVPQQSPSQYTDVVLFDRMTGQNQLINHLPAEAATAGNGQSVSPLISADGSTIVFDSVADNLAFGVSDRNGQQDIYWMDRATGVIHLASHNNGVASATAGGQSVPNSENQISADGRYFVFTSTATNLVPGQNGPHTVGNDFAGGFYQSQFANVFLYDRVTQTTSLVSHTFGSANQTGSRGSANAIISADGRYVVYSSFAEDLIPGFVDSNGPGVNSYSGCDLYLFDRMTGANQLISHQDGSIYIGGNFDSGTYYEYYQDTPTISADGRYIAYTSYASNLLSGFVDVNGANDVDGDVFLFDRLTGQNVLVSHSFGGMLVGSNLPANTPDISGDGRYVVFRSQGNNLAPQAGQALFFNIYVYDRTTGAVTLLSHDAGNSALIGNGDANDPDISADGHYVAYQSLANNLILGGADNMGYSDIFLYDMSTGANTLVSHAVSALTTADGSGPSYSPWLSNDGRYLVFVSDAQELIGGFVDKNGFGSGVGGDVYLYDRVVSQNKLVSHSATSLTAGGNGWTSFARISGDGRFVAYASVASDVTNGTDKTPNSRQNDVILYDQLTGLSTLVTHDAGDGLKVGTGESTLPALSQDGSILAFQSSADNLVAGDYNGACDIFAYVTPPPQVASVQINDGNPQRSIIRSITVNFDEPVFFTGDPASAFTLTRNGSAGSVQLAVSSVSNNPNGSITLTFGGSLTQFGSLIDGKYTLTIDASKVSNIAGLDGNGDGVAGDNWVSADYQIYRLFGDANGDHRVDGLDYSVFRMTYNTNNDIFSFDGTGPVDGFDFGQFRQRFGVVI